MASLSEATYPPADDLIPFDLAQLRGTVAVITGAGSGIGEGVAQHAAHELGMKVCIVDIREAAAVEAAERIVANGGEAVGLQGDVTDDGSMAALPAKVAAAFPGVPLKLLHANAGVLAGGGTGPVGSGDTGIVDGLDLEGWDFTFAVNVMGVVRTLKTMVPVMTAQNEPAVVITTATASMAGITSSESSGGGLVAYFSSKHACVSLTESLHAELQRSEAGKKIAVHVLCPALVSSQLSTSSADVQAKMAGDDDHEEQADGEDWGASNTHAVCRCSWFWA
jgi:NAD(P)-dependent dehydrogenase (short-subunit alcohol dehydrogenase family)